METRKRSKIPETADDKEQSERFIDAARKHEVDETGESLERMFRKVVPPKTAARSKTR